MALQLPSVPGAPGEPNIPVMVTSLRIRVNSGVRILPSELTPETYSVASGVKAYAGTVTLTPSSIEQDNALAEFHLLLNGDDNEVDLPLYRNVGEPGLLQGVQNLKSTGVADKGDDESAVTLSWDRVTNPPDKSKDEGRGLLVVGRTIVKVRSWDSEPGETGGIAVVKPRLDATADEQTVFDGVLKVTFLSSVIQLAQDRDARLGFSAITYPWVQTN